MFTLIIEARTFSYQQIHAHKPLFGNQGRLLDLGHLYFDTPQRTPGRIVSTARCPAEDLELRISDFNLPDNSLPNMMIQSTTNNHLSFISNHCALGIFTTVESALQIRPFMQNKANFQKSQMNVNKVLTKDYEKRTLGERGKNKPNSNPIQSQTKPISNQVHSL